MSTPLKSLEEAAQYLAEVNHEYEPQITRTYWFNDPAGKEIRLIHIDPNTSGSYEQVSPFYFGASKGDPEPLPKSAVALVRPEEECRLALPNGWGDWESATVWEWK